MVVMKGAPEIVFNRCSSILIEGKNVEINEEVREKFYVSNRELASKGERVLGFCDLVLPANDFQSGHKFETSMGTEFPIQGLR